MKSTWRNAHDVFADVERLLAVSATAVRRSPLDELVELLYRERRWQWVAVYLPAERHAWRGGAPEKVAAAPFAAPIRIAGRTLGYVAASGSELEPLAAEDRILLKQVAFALARFLTTGGKRFLKRISGGAETVSREAAAGERNRR